MNAKGIVLVGGTGSRLYPATFAVNKHFMPVYDKPMVYYPMTTLMLAGIRDILIITMTEDHHLFQQLLGDGSKWGIHLTYAERPKLDGLAEAFLIAETFIGNDKVALALGDNLFYSDCLKLLLEQAMKRENTTSLFAHSVRNPEQYGVVEFNSEGRALSIEEKPQHPKSHYAVTGLYFYDNQVVTLAKELKPTIKSRLELFHLNQFYLQQNNLHVDILGHGYTWFDMGTHDALLHASQFVAAMEHQQGVKVACPEEVAYRQGWIDEVQLEALAQPLCTSGYGQYLLHLLEEKPIS